MTKKHYVYILISISNGKYYIGCTGNLEKRLKAHNNGKVRSTKAYRPSRVISVEAMSDRQSAFRREQEIKSYKGGEAFKRLVQV